MNTFEVFHLVKRLDECLWKIERMKKHNLCIVHVFVAQQKYSLPADRTEVVSIYVQVVILLPFSGARIIFHFIFTFFAWVSIKYGVWNNVKVSCDVKHNLRVFLHRKKWIFLWQTRVIRAKAFTHSAKSNKNAFCRFSLEWNHKNWP